MDSVVHIKKKGGLDSIVINKGQKIRPEIYYQRYKDRSGDGVPMGEYKEGMILDAKHYLAPFWDGNRKQWRWSAGPQKLGELIKKLGLKYEKNHPESGKVIPVGNPEERLKDFYDPIFRHSHFYGKRFLQDSKGVLYSTDIVDEFLNYCYEGSNQVENGKLKSKYSEEAKYVMTSPKGETKKKAVLALKDVNAKELLGVLYHNEPKVRALCTIMDLPAYRDTIDAEAAWLLLDEASSNTGKSSKYGGKTVQEAFIEYAKMPDEDLEVAGRLVAALKRGFIRKYTDYYVFDGEKIHYKSLNSLMNHFKDPKNQEPYIKLLEMLEHI